MATRAKVHARQAASESGASAPAPTGRRPGGSAARPPGRRRRSALRALPGAVGALLMLAVLLAGVPALLYYGTHAVAVMGGETHRSLRELLTSPDDGRLFLWALVGIGWIGWLCFAFSVLLEIPAQLRGRVARRLPAFGWSQRMAAGLVGAVIALLPVAGASFAAVPGQLTGSAAPAQLVAAPQYPALTAAPNAAPTLALPAADPAQPSYTVRDSRPADSLWSIAEHQLGDGGRWQEIAKLNAGRVMDDSGTHFDADRPIQPGWQLLMPADARQQAAPAATGAAPAGPGPSTGERHAAVTVREGDTLSAIAQRELGSSQAWPQLFEANKGVQAPDGERLTNPDLVAPGMVLAIPGAPAPAPSPAPASAAAPAAAPVQSAPADPGAVVAPGAKTPSAAASAPAGTGKPAPVTTGKSGPAAHRSADPAQHGAKAEAPGDDYTGALEVAGAGVLLAVAMIGAVSHRRGAQQRARRPRHRIPMPSPAAATFESELRARQNSTGLDLLNRSLRTMARNVVRTGKRLPALAAVRVTTGGTVELHLAVAATPIAPFRAAHAANIWWCAADSADLLTEPQAAKVPAPYPALVTLGTAPDGAAVLADLETVRLLHLAGDADEARDVLRTIALELAHSPLADRLNLHLVGFAEDLPVSDTVVERVRRYATLEAALAAVGPRTALARASLLDAGASHPRDARSRGQADQAWVPEIVLSAQPPGGEVPAELGRLLDSRPRTCLAVVTRSPERGTGPVARWTLPTSGQATLPGLQIALRLQRLTDEQYGHWTELMHTAGSAEQEPAPAWTFDGDELEPADLPKPVPVLVGAGAPGGLPFVGASLPEGPPEVGPRLIARLIGTGSSPFATTDPAAALGSTGPGGVGAAPVAGGPSASGEPFVPSLGGSSSGGLPVGGPSMEGPQANGGLPGPSPVNPSPFDAGPLGSGPLGSGPANTGPLGSGPAGPGPAPTGQFPALPPAPRHSVNNRGLQASSATHPTFVPAATQVPADPTPVLPEPAPEPVAPEFVTPEPVAPAAAMPAPVPEPDPAHDAAPAPAPSDPRVPLRPEPAPQVRPATIARTDSDDLLAILRSPEAHAVRTAPRIRLLGPVDVAGAGGPADPAALVGLTELAAYVALHPGCGPGAVDRALHPGDHARPDQALPASLTDLATWFGAAPDGRAFLRRDTPESCTFAPTVTCDWDEFRSLYRRGMRSTSTTADAALAHALALVRGAPFAEAPATGYGWAEAARQDMLAAIVDTAHELAARRLQYGDHRSAEAAVFRGLAVAPDVELLHRDLFYAYASAGARDQLLKAVNRLDALSRRTGRNLDPDTVALLRDLLSGA